MEVLMITRPLFLALALVALLMLPCAQVNASSRADTERDARHALGELYQSRHVAKELAKNAKAILIFPNIVKGGLIFGGSYGKGILLKGNDLDGYYNTASASWGLQAGAQSYGYALFLMSDKAVKYVHDTHGWEIGVGPTVVVVDEGVGKNLSTTTAKDDAYAFIFDQQGLMAGISIEGSKITHIKG
jgi:lipid-binding SYLF domain-containing protein